MPSKSKKKTRYTDRELSNFEKVIDQKITQAEEQLHLYSTQITDLNESGEAKFKSLGESTTSMEAERLSELATRQRKLIHHLENAKLRIQNKVYGICRETGALISKERLMAVPHATLSIAAKQKK